MRIKLLFITIALILFSFCANAQNSVYWRDTNSTGLWQFGSGCGSGDNDGNWYYPPASGSGNRQRPDCAGTFNIIYFANYNNPNMDLNAGPDYSANQIQFTIATVDRVIGSSSGRRIFFQNNIGNCKIENYVAVTTHTFNVDIFVNSGGNNMEINPVFGFLYFNRTITNNSNNPINIYGAQQVTFAGNITGNPGVTINSTATVVYTGVSKTYTGTTTINSGTRLRISSNQTLGNIALNGGTLEIDAGATLTLTGTYTSTGGTIVNNGVIKFAGGPVTFPGSVTVNTATRINTLAGFEAASSGIVTLNKLLRVTNAITVSSGTLLLSGNDLRLENATLNIATGAIFDNGGENQIINDGSGTINITGTFITRDKDGFVGSTTAIPSITPTLNAGSTVEYGLNGNQDVQGSIITTYQNITISGSGTKTLASTIPIAGTILTKDSAIFDVGSNTFGSGSTPLTMQGTSTYKVGGSDVKPDAGGLYTLGTNTTMEFTGTSATQIRLVPSYANIIVSGTNVKAGSTDEGGLTFQNPGTFTVKNSAVFKVTNATGFTGSLTAAIKNTSNPTITLEPGSTVEYSGATQTITLAGYSNLTISGTGTKTLASTSATMVGNNLSVNASTLLIDGGKALTVTNNVAVSIGATMTLETNFLSQSASLVQINNTGSTAGNINYVRNYNGIAWDDYTYWSSPVAGQNLLALSPETKLDKFFSFDAAANDWKPENPITTPMDVGKGYIIRAKPYTGTGVPPGFFTNTFRGIPNNGVKDVPIYWTNGDPLGTSNLIGNPYPSAIDAVKFLTTNAGVIESTIYFWTNATSIQNRNLITGTNPDGTPKVGTGELAYTTDDYASFNLTGGVATGNIIPGTPPTTDNSNRPDGTIAAGQGFFTTSLTTNAVSTATFNNSMRVSSTNAILSNSQFFKTRNTKETTVFEKHRIWLNLRNTQGVFKQTLIGYLTDATNQYDNRFDGVSFDANEFADFYSVNQDKNLVIQGRALPFDENDEVPLGFRTTIDGAFTINIDQTDGVLTNQSVFIEDKLTNTIFDLRSSPYTFTTKSGTFNDRFVLRYTNKTLGTKDVVALENQVLVSNKNKQIKVSSAIEIIDNVTVYDLLGRRLFKKEKVNNNELAIPNLVSSQQTLLVKVSLQNGQTVTRKIMY